MPFGEYAQERVPPEEMGRVTSFIYTLCCIGNPVGSAIASPIADLVGVNVLFVGLGILLALNGAICFVSVRKHEVAYVKEKALTVEE